MKQIFTIFLLSISLLNFAQYNPALSIGGNAERNGLSEFLGPLDNPQTYWDGGEYAAYAQYPIIEGDKLVVGRRTQANSQIANIVCYNVYTGAELWNIQLPVSATSDTYGNVSAIHNGVVYATKARGVTKPANLIALDINNGNVLWESASTITQDFNETVNFNSNGDIIAIKNQHSYICIDKNDGSTLWIIEKELASGGYCSTMAVNGDIGYCYNRAPGYATIITAFDLTTGDSLRSSGTLMTGDSYTQQNMALTLSPAGNIYVHTSEGKLFSLTDNGSSISIDWFTPVSIFIIGGNFGVGPDLSIYSVTQSGKLCRINHLNGEIIDSSATTIFTNEYYTSGSPAVNQHPEIAIGADSVVYLSTEQYPNYRLAFYTPDLNLIWEETADDSSPSTSLWGLRGLALGDSVLVVNAKNNVIRAYKGRELTTTSISQTSTEETNLNIYPNPTSNKIFIDNVSENLVVNISDITGRQILSNKTIISGKMEIDLSDFPSGIYFININNKSYKIIKN